MPDWATFAGFAGVVLVLLLLLAHASKSVVSGDAATPASAPTPGEQHAPGSVDPSVADAPHTNRIVDSGPTDSTDLDSHLTPVDASDHWTDRAHATGPQLSTMALLANVAVSQGAFGFLLVAGAWFTEIPLSAFGVPPSLPSVTTLGVGVALGLALYLANEVGSTVGERLGVGADESLREALAPASVGGWVVLLVVVLPTIAAFEELLFRGVLVGVFSAGFGVSPWLLAGLSSVAFALGHGAQGPAGVAVTGILGFVLAAAFVLTGSLLVVIVAHYLVNALEFVVHEAPDTGWA
ncbi:CPBP family intramembrane glutamic endopeptidase [Salinigranum salinum]|uniref:CPBP family intramembrane glutamic endopeptidase n=1 Tax=Salinigranum salinum TaxID=1364937 RepID=UPI0012607991|nr:type II CAAX endopeptidase family protein [Salinigranum salinum]